MNPRMLRKSLALALALLPAWAMAHVGGDAGAHHGFGAGFAHPFTGVDHLLAMLLIGLWSATLLQRWWMAPLAFVVMLTIGALASTTGFALPAVEPAIALSLVVLGALLAWRAAWPAAAMAAVAGAFALFHGAAHGAELEGAAALAGMVAATGLLHVAGLLAGRALQQRSVWWPRAAGIAASLFGAALLFGVA